MTPSPSDIAARRALDIAGPIARRWAEEEAKRGRNAGGDKAALQRLITQGCEMFWREVFGDQFWVDLAPHQLDALQWHFDSRTALCKGERPPNDWFAYFPIWSRGNNKTTLAEMTVVVDAMISFAFSVPGFCLYIGREKEKVKENIASIEKWFYLPTVKKYCPQLAQASRAKKGDEPAKDTNEQGRWTAWMLQTAANYTIKGVTVDSANAG